MYGKVSEMSENEVAQAISELKDVSYFTNVTTGEEYEFLDLAEQSIMLSNNVGTAIKIKKAEFTNILTHERQSELETSDLEDIEIFKNKAPIDFGFHTYVIKYGRSFFKTVAKGNVTALSLVKFCDEAIEKSKLEKASAK